MSTTVKALISGAVAIASIAAVAGVIMVLVAHGGINDTSLSALGILVGVIGTQIPSILGLLKTQQVDSKVSNGLIPAKVEEALKLPAVQTAIRTVVEDVFASHTNAVVNSSQPDTPAQPKP